MSHDDFAREPVPGLPERLPPGERLLWQGAPCWPRFAREVFHVRKLALYFLLLIGWQLADALADGVAAAAPLRPLGFGVLLAATLLGGLLVLARLYCRTTLYSITDRRVTMRFGLALTLTVNLPYRRIAAAAVRTEGDGGGSIALRLHDDARVSYLVMWPCVRPWRFSPPQPALRALAEIDEPARVLGRALAAYAGQTPTEDAPQSAAALPAPGSRWALW